MKRYELLRHCGGVSVGQSKFQYFPGRLTCQGSERRQQVHPFLQFVQRLASVLVGCSSFEVGELGWWSKSAKGCSLRVLCQVRGPSKTRPRSGPRSRPVRISFAIHK